jgi:hypothetical protein
MPKNKNVKLTSFGKNSLMTQKKKSEYKNTLIPDLSQSTVTDGNFLKTESS